LSDLEKVAQEAPQSAGGQLNPLRAETGQLVEDELGDIVATKSFQPEFP
jgi:hypothetical protein